MTTPVINLLIMNKYGFMEQKMCFDQLFHFFAYFWGVTPVLALFWFANISI